MPGTWVSLAFMVSASDQAIHGELAAFELPLGWSMVVPPPPVSLAQGETQTLTLALAVPKNAPAGWHEILMTLAHQSVSAEVYVEASVSLEWLTDDATTTQPHRWWTNRPWVGRASLLLTGNQPLEVTLVSRAPPDVVVNLSPVQQTITPDAPIDVDIEVHTHPDRQHALPKHLPIAVDVFDAKQQSVLLSRQWVLLPLATDEDQLGHRPWRLRGFVDWRSSLRERSEGIAQPSHWGIQGSGHWDRSGDQAVSFVWHKEARWGRYVGFDGKHFRWRVGHQVFVGERLDGLSRLGQGLSSTWQSDEGYDAWRVGWIQFHSQGGHGQDNYGQDNYGQDNQSRADADSEDDAPEVDRKGYQYISPWWSWRGWRVAYMGALSDEGHGASQRGVWSLSYQKPVESIGQQAAMSSHWRVHVNGNREEIAGRFEYRRRFPDQTRWGIMAESIPKDHISDLSAGTRLRIRSHHPLAHEASIQNSFLASHESGTSKAGYRRYLWTAQYWQPVIGLAGLNKGDLQLGLGATHRRDQAWIRRASSAGITVKESTHRSELSLRLRGRVGTWHLSGHLDTHRRFGLASHWLQPDVGRWRLSLQNTVKQVSLESLGSGPWRWSVELARHKQLVSSSQRADVRSPGIKEVSADNEQLHLGLARRTQRGQEWSATLSASLSDRQDLMLWLRYRWQANLPSPVPMIQRLVGYHSGHVIAGCARQITPAGPKPVVGALVFLNNKSTLTDREGCYRFVGLAAGLHRLAIEPSLPQSMPAGVSAIKEPLKTSDWLLTTSDRVDLLLDSSLSSSAVSSLGDQNHQELTHDWSWVQPSGLVATIDWPDESLLDEPSRDAVLDELRLVGTCPACPAAHQKRTAKRNADGQWVVEQLLPGDWRWQWAGGLLPSEHEFAETHQSLALRSGQTHTLVWAMRYRPRTIEWQRTEVVELAP